MTVDLAADGLALLSRYIQFDTSHKNELAAAHWLAEQIRGRGITQDVTVLEPAAGRGLVIARIPGTEPLKPLLVNHHIDVVVADPAQWTHPPFAGEIAEGCVWGRGALDDKGMGIALLLGLEALVRAGVRFRRPVVFTAVPDEETHGAAGTGWLVAQQHAALDPAWVWDEGGAGFADMFGPRPFWGIATCEKQVHLVRVQAAGQPGHGSMPHQHNPNNKLVAALGRALAQPRPFTLAETTRTMFATLAPTQRFPASALLARLDGKLAQRLADPRIAADPQLNAFVRDTLSLNVLQGGAQANVIPERAEALLDCRLLPGTDPDEFDAWLARRLGRGVTCEVVARSPRTAASPLDAPLYAALHAAALAATPRGAVFPLQVPGATDGRFWRAAGVPAYGLSPFLMTKADIASVHGIDERLAGENLALGAGIAQSVIRAVCA